MLTDKSFSHRKVQGLLSNLTLCHLLDTSMCAWESHMDSSWMDGYMDGWVDGRTDRWMDYNVYC